MTVLSLSRLLTMSLIVSLSACDSGPETNNTTAEITDSAPSNDLIHSADAPTQNQTESYALEDKHYLYDVTEHTTEELRALLERINDIMEVSPEAFENLKIVMILHGPDIDLFTKQNYEKNKIVVDLAAKLDSIEVVDMQACETTMDSLGVEREQLPDFIETVPFAPDTMRTLKNQGYVNL